MAVRLAMLIIAVIVARVGVVFVGAGVTIAVGLTVDISAMTTMTTMAIAMFIG